MLKFTNKINFVISDHLNKANMGWRFVSQELRLFHSDKGINCYEWLDKAVKEKAIKKDWMGFLHNTISYPSEYPLKYQNNRITFPLSRLIHDRYFLDKLLTCKGIFVFTEQNRKFLQQELGFNEVYFLHHPSRLYQNNWIQSDYLLHVGQQCRRFHSYLDLESNYKKMFLQPHLRPLEGNSDIQEMKQYGDDCDLIYVSRASDEDYVSLLCRSIVFLDLYDVAACNTIIECIMLNVPIVINKLPGCVEYLGEEYPLYFSSIEDAKIKIHDKKLIEQAHFYLKNMNKDHMKMNNFLFKLQGIIC